MSDFQIKANSCQSQLEASQFWAGRAYAIDLRFFFFSGQNECLVAAGQRGHMAPPLCPWCLVLATTPLVIGSSLCVGKLASTRTIYENKLLQLMKQCPGTAAELNSEVNSENDGEGKTTEVVIQTNGLKVTTEHTSGSENLQEILPEGKVALHRSQGPRKKVGSPERNYRQKTSDLPHQDFGYPDVNVTVGESARRRRNAIKENPPSVKKDPETKCHVVPGRSREGRIPMRVKIAAFAIFMFLLFVYVTMETNFHNPFTSFATGK
uniref:LEM domain-containing protein 1 isoform X3 n=1 Tax=Podarcis muralis TaxID=64176 RepID=UPI0010A0B210|nr:LEM domain-containing protein 1 isoform X3 [Podarcis muralis]